MLNNSLIDEELYWECLRLIVNGNKNWELSYYAVLNKLLKEVNYLASKNEFNKVVKMMIERKIIIEYGYYYSELLYIIKEVNLKKEMRYLKLKYINKI